MVSPAVLLIVAVAFFPVAYSVYLSLHAAKITGAGAWVGLANYREIFQDAKFTGALFNTALFTVVSVSIELVLGLGIALGLNQAFRGRGVVRTAVLLPWAFPVVVSALMWRLMLQDQVGIVSYVVHSLGLANSPILSNRTSLLIAAILVDVWKTTPFMALLLLAGLQTLPKDIVEAAQVDGASAVRRLRSITLPLLKPTILVALLFRTLEAWGVYDLFWVMTDRQLDSLSTYTFEGVRISQLDFAPGTAAAVFTFFAAVGIALFFITVLGTRTADER
ncbi:MAG: trehalose/maltose transport system permease protein [Solirubrobacteraceae bacterium]|jgi:multiple sugar transport system permease protein|nr:trehalose/maltose transport system permease protein [Solirubrobacteraceae bacterium]